MDWNDLFNKWYMFLSSLNSMLSLPMRDLSNDLGIPLVSVFLFGLLGATAPCQLSTNFGALAFLTRQPADRAATFRATLAYIAAKMLVYTILGLVVLTLGQKLINSLVLYVDWVRRLIGPLMIVLGLALLGVFRFRFQVGQGLARRLEREASSLDRRERATAEFTLERSEGLMPTQVRLVPEVARPRQSLVPAAALAGSGSMSASADVLPSEGVPVTPAPSLRSSFLLGLGFSLAFCPTLFLLFFGITMTLAARSAGGFAFPAIFTLGATLPLLLLVGLTLTSSGAARRVRRGMRRANRPLRWLGAAVLIFFGLHDTLIYWFL